MRSGMLCSHEFSFCPIDPGFGKKRKALHGGKPQLRWGEEPVLHLASVVAALCMPLPFFFTKEVKRSCAVETLMLTTYNTGIMLPPVCEACDAGTVNQGISKILQSVVCTMHTE
ncbi:hypothetical protein ABZP36_025912 [Zizania latifolia]